MAGFDFQRIEEAEWWEDFEKDGISDVDLLLLKIRSNIAVGGSGKRGSRISMTDGGQSGKMAMLNVSRTPSRKKGLI